MIDKDDDPYSLLSSDMKDLRKYANEVLKQKKKRDSRGIMTNLAMVKKIADSAIKSMSNKSKVLKNLYMESSL
ncbi:MAG: hypothetical protein CMH64_03030 [Nanoarchaeota archaeon]|jgi:hypothetical protein|nr:hypothetical protein [Nanoarchaeota archaeon]|tara:strand:- start:11910 stop:12128 length:219 start_codon:yes stop_codon:yes gene_type:complete